MPSSYNSITLEYKPVLLDLIESQALDFNFLRRLFTAKQLFICGIGLRTVLVYIIAIKIYLVQATRFKSNIFCSM